jgi:hypothetical protein
VQARRPSESDTSSLDSLLSWADDREKKRIEELLKELQQTQQPPPQPSGDQAGDARVAKTRAEAAQLLGVDERTISKWAADPTFPGKAGTAGQRNGHFPIEAIQRWRQQITGGGVASEEDADPAQRLRLRKLAAETARREVDLEMKLGTLIDRDQAEATITSAIATARSLLEELPEQIAEAIPASRAKLRRFVARIVRRKVLQVLESLADCATEDSDDSDDDAPRTTDAGRRTATASAPQRPAKAAGVHPRRVGGGAKAPARPVVPRKSKARPAGRK